MGGATLTDASLVQQLSVQLAQAVRSRHGLAPASAAAPAAPAVLAALAAPAVPAVAPASSCDANRRGIDRGMTGGRKRSAGQMSASAYPAAPAVACTRAAPATASGFKKKKKKKKKKKTKQRSASDSLRAGGVGVRRGECVGAVD